MNGDQSECVNDMDLSQSQCRRKAVHFAQISDFLASLNIGDTSLKSLQGLRTLSLEDYLRVMRGQAQMSSPPSPPTGDGNRGQSVGKPPNLLRHPNREECDTSNTVSIVPAEPWTPQDLWLKR
ncbi:hypothetical protein KR018_003357 [Drosophila ironensis]|nr:hypothetical protein KR018_003357 [Drosophila ironensis]